MTDTRARTRPGMARRSTFGGHRCRRSAVATCAHRDATCGPMSVPSGIGCSGTWAGLDDAAWHLPGAAPSDAGGPAWSLAEHVGHIADWLELATRLHDPGDRDRRLAVRHDTTTATSTRSTRVGANRGRRCPATRSSAAWRPPGRVSSRSRSGSPPRRLRSDDSWRWVYRGPARPLSRPSRGHRAVDRRTASSRRPSLMPTAPITPSPNLSIEAIVAVDTPREFRLHPRDRVVAFTAEAAGARQLFTLALRGGYPIQLTASEKPVSDPRWSPDGRRLAFVRDDEIWVDRIRRLAPDPGRRQARRRSRPALVARWPSPRIPVAPPRLVADLADRCPGPEARPAGDRAQAAATDRPDRDQASTSTRSNGRPTARGSRSWPVAARPSRRPSQIALVDVATGTTRVVAGERSVDVAARWLPDGSLLFVSDADGWFQVVRLTADGHDRIVLTEGEREHGEPGGGPGGSAPLPSPDGSRFVHIEVHDGLQDLRRRRAGRQRRPPNEDADGRRRRHGPSRRPRPATGSTRGTASGDRSAGWPTAPGSPRSANARRSRRTSGCSPSPASPPTMPGHARSPTRSRPSSARRCHPAASRRRSVSPSRHATACPSRATCGAR